MRSTRKFARGAKKNYAFFITFSLKFWKISPPPPLLIFGKFPLPQLFQPSPPRLLIFGKFSNPSGTILTPRLLAYKRVHILANISRSKGNQTMKFGQLIQYNMRAIFLEKSFSKCGGETISRLLSKKSKLSISLDQ